MNVYDFDKTIYPVDSVLSFAFWCLNRHPKLWVTFVPQAIKSFVLRQLGKMPEYRFQREFYKYLAMIDDFDEQIERYWDKNEKRIVPWYLAQKRPDDLIISASPICIIEPIARRLGVSFMATEYDREFGVFTNNMMYAKEKARYILDRDYPQIENFYSDSLSDTPVALLADKAHLVSKHATVISDWPELDETTFEHVRRKVDTGWRIHLK